MLLPGLTRRYEFRDSSGATAPKTVVMTDGGVYDNLGLSPLLPGRSPRHTSHVYDLDYLIAADAGRGRNKRVAARFMLGRLTQTFDITYGKTQDASRSRIHLVGESGQIKGLIIAYLGMRDNNLPVPLADLVPRRHVESYPTNFARMSSEALIALASAGNSSHECFSATTSRSHIDFGADKPGRLGAPFKVDDNHIPPRDVCDHVSASSPATASSRTSRSTSSPVNHRASDPAGARSTQSTSRTASATACK